MDSSTNRAGSRLAADDLRAAFLAAHHIAEAALEPRDWGADFEQAVAECKHYAELEGLTIVADHGPTLDPRSWSWALEHPDTGRRTVATRHLDSLARWIGQWQRAPETLRAQWRDGARFIALDGERSPAWLR